MQSTTLALILAMLHAGASATVVGGKGHLLNLRFTGTIQSSNSLEATASEVVPGVYEVTARTWSQGVGLVATRHLLVLDRLGALKGQAIDFQFLEQSVGVRVPALVYAYEWPNDLSRARVAAAFKRSPTRALARLRLAPTEPQSPLLQ